MIRSWQDLEQYWTIIEENEEEENNDGEEDEEGIAELYLGALKEVIALAMEGWSSVTTMKILSLFDGKGK